MLDQCTLAKKDDIMDIFDSLSFFKDLEFININTYEVLQKLNEKYDIYLTSIGRPQNLANKAFYLQEHLPFIKNYIFLYNGDCKADKSIVDMSNGIILDDMPDNLETSNAEFKLLFGDVYTWNDTDKFQRVFNYTDIESVLL